MSSESDALRQAVAQNFRQRLSSCPECVGKALGRTTDEVRSYMRHPLELGHEFERKVITEASAKGRELFRQHGARFCAADHGPLFFTAVAANAWYFGLAPEDLVELL